MTMKIDVLPAAAMAETDHRFDPQLSNLLTESLRQDDVEQMLQALSEAGLGTQHLDGHLSVDSNTQSQNFCLPFCSNTTVSNQVSFSRIAHLCILMQSSRVLQFITTEHPRLLTMLDDSGSTLLHCLAKANSLLRSGFGGNSLVDSFDSFQSSLFTMLAGVQSPTGGQEHGSTSSLLQQLCLLENSGGLRPLEFSILIGAYSTFLCIIHVDGYILKNRASHGIRVRSTFDLTEYDPLSGERRDKSPLLMLTLLTSDQVDHLSESGLLEVPIMKKWMKSSVDDLGFAIIILSAFQPMMGHILGVYSVTGTFSASLIQSGYYLETGLYEYGRGLKSYLEMNGTVDSSADFGIQVRQYCSSDCIIQYLMDQNNSANTATRFTMPIAMKPVSRKNIIEMMDMALYIMMLYISIQLLVVAYNVFKDRKLFANSWMPSRRNLFVYNRYHLGVLIIGLCFGLIYCIAAWQIKGNLDCSNFVLGVEKQNQRLSALVHISECSAVLFLVFDFFAIIEAYELSGKPLALMAISFRKMLEKFLLVLPLLILWAYLILGSLFYLTDFNGQQFKTPGDVFYSPLLLMLNMANPPHTLTVCLLHTVFVMIITINVANFIIAFISNTFKEVAKTFDTIYPLIELNRCVRLARLYGFLPRLLRACCGSKKKNRGVFKTWRLKSR